MWRLSKIIKIILKILIIVFAIWGFALTLVFFAMKFGFTKSDSLIDKQSGYFKELLNTSQGEANNINNEREKFANQNFLPIQNLKEWLVIKEGIIKDKEIIEQVSEITGVNERLIITPLIAEQLRLMTSEREIFKKYFQPLAILGSQTQYSLGIYGIKEGTAKGIERNLKDYNSQYYLGERYANLLNYTNSTNTLLVDAWTLEPVKSNSNSTTSTSSYQDTILLTGEDADRISRLTDSHNHYYSYLYAALYLKQLMTAWDKAGYSIDDRPEIIATLFNIGFNNSHPNPNPQAGGAEIDLNGKKYTFGSIAYYFYYSDQLTDTFGR